MMKAITKRLQFHLVNNFVDKRKLKKQLCLLKAYTALLHIEQGSIVKLTDSAAMRTLHIIGIYLQHRLGEHTGSLGGTKILISFLRYCLLSTMTYQHTTSKGSSSLTIEYIFIKFIAGTMSHLMINECIVIYDLILIGNDTTIAETFCSLALEHQVETVACDTIMRVITLWFTRLLACCSI